MKRAGKRGQGGESARARSHVLAIAYRDANKYVAVGHAICMRDVCQFADKSLRTQFAASRLVRYYFFVHRRRVVLSSSSSSSRGRTRSSGPPQKSTRLTRDGRIETKCTTTTMVIVSSDPVSATELSVVGMFTQDSALTACRATHVRAATRARVCARQQPASGTF